MNISIYILAGCFPSPIPGWHLLLACWENYTSVQLRDLAKYKTTLIDMMLPVFSALAALPSPRE